MYFFLSDRYTEPSVLIRSPECIQEELEGLTEALTVSEALRARLQNAKETLSELSALVPDSLAGELYARIRRAEEEYEHLSRTFEEKNEELKEALLMLGRLREGRGSL